MQNEQIHLYIYMISLVIQSSDSFPSWAKWDLRDFVVADSLTIVSHPTPTKTAGSNHPSPMIWLILFYAHFLIVVQENSVHTLKIFTKSEEKVISF